MTTPQNPITDPPEVDPPEADPPVDLPVVDPPEPERGFEGILVANQICDDVECNRPDGCPEHCSWNIEGFVPLDAYGQNAEDARLGRASSHLSACMIDPLTDEAAPPRPTELWTVLGNREVYAALEGVFRRHLDAERLLSGQGIVFATLRGDLLQTEAGSTVIELAEIEPDLCRTAELTGSCLIPEEGDLCLFETLDSGEAVTRRVDPDAPPSVWMQWAPGRGAHAMRFDAVMPGDDGSETSVRAHIDVPDIGFGALACPPGAVCPIWWPNMSVFDLTVGAPSLTGELPRVFEPTWAGFTIDSFDVGELGVMNFSVYAVDGRGGVVHLWGAQRGNSNDF